MWKYIQSTGEIFRNDELVGVGYSGRDEGKNNPLMQCKKDVGPIPRGWWTIEEPTD